VLISRRNARITDRLEGQRLVPPAVTPLAGFQLFSW
jgi:hypothetical protein